jgi:hypothetical protein
VEADLVEEAELFRAIDRSGARAILIGRRALVVLGLPVMTADYDFWLHADDVDRFNAALAPLGLASNYSPAEARQRGRYVLENGEHVDVLIARELRTVTGEVLSFEDAWHRRQRADLAAGVHVFLPDLDDLIVTKRVAPRPKDQEDIRLLEVLRGSKLSK